jgi:hypothetical protein
MLLYALETGAAGANRERGGSSVGSRWAGTTLTILAVLSAGAAHGADNSLSAAWVEPKAITILPSSDVPVGTKVTVVCSWAQTGTVIIPWGSVNHHVLDTNNWNLPSEIVLDGKRIGQFKVPAKINAAGLTAGSATAEWTPSTPGTHNGSCIADYLEGMVSQWPHSTQVLLFSVKVKPLPIGSIGNAPVKAVPGIGAGPQLGVLSALPAIQNSCVQGSPAAIFTLSVRNAGGPLAAGQGTVMLKEVGSTGSLASAGVPLPAIGQSGTANVKVPVTTPNLHSTLAGSHQLAVHFTIAGPQPAPATRPSTFPVVFPPNYCGGPANTLAPAGGTAPRNPNLPAVRQPATPRSR